MKLTCCFIPDEHQAAARDGKAFASCQSEAEWEIYGPKTEPHMGTYACAEHVGLLLEDGEHRLFPIGSAAGGTKTSAGHAALQAERDRFAHEATEAKSKLGTTKNNLSAAMRRTTALEVMGGKVNAIRNSIVGMQGFNFSEHAYPLVYALNEAGFKGEPYEMAAKNLGTLIEQCKTAEANAQRLLDMYAGVYDLLKAFDVYGTGGDASSCAREILMRLSEKETALEAALRDRDEAAAQNGVFRDLLERRGCDDGCASRSAENLAADQPAPCDCDTGKALAQPSKVAEAWCERIMAEAGKAAAHVTDMVLDATLDAVGGVADATREELEALRATEREQQHKLDTLADSEAALPVRRARGRLHVRGERRQQVSDQRKKSRALAFKNPMRLADEHAEMVTKLREIFGDGKEPRLIDPTDPVCVEVVRALIAEVDRR